MNEIFDFNLKFNYFVIMTVPLEFHLSHQYDV
jgi:hypothetical protein